MSIRRRFNYALLLTTSIGLWFALAWAVQTKAPRTTRLAEPDPMADGPHVTWTADTAGNPEALVWYYCEGWNTSERLESGDTVWFTGTCNDFGRRYRLVAAPPSIHPARVSGVGKFLAVSDIHGDYDHLVPFLQNAGVIDSALHWQFGDGHLVIDGDVFDRGDKVTECLWLIHQLEWQAREAGGAVHMLLGNHEAMVLRGDERYVNEKYMMGIVAFHARADGDSSGYRDLFGPSSELGRWLRSQNTAIVINDILFVHGGISPELVRQGLSLDAINTAVRTGLDYVIRDTAIPAPSKFVHGRLGPLWYRGWQYGIDGSYPEIGAAQLDSVLAEYGATAAVAGHSEIDSVMSMHDGKVYFIDIPVEERNGFEGLYWEAGDFFRVRTDGSRVRLN